MLDTNYDTKAVEGFYLVAQTAAGGLNAPFAANYPAFAKVVQGGILPVTAISALAPANIAGKGWSFLGKEKTESSCLNLKLKLLKMIRK